MKTMYKGRWDCLIMVDYCWSLKRDCHRRGEPGRKNRKKQFMLCTKKVKVSTSLFYPASIIAGNISIFACSLYMC